MGVRWRSISRDISDHAGFLRGYCALEEFYTLTREATPEQFDIINNECHAVIAVMQNALYPGFFGTHLPVSYLQQLKIPMILLSLGVQFRFGDTIELTPEDVDSLKWLRQCREFTGSRPYEPGTACALRYPQHSCIGLPEPVWSGTRELKLKPPSYDNVGFTITDMGAIPVLHEFQFDIMKKVFNPCEEILAGRAGRRIRPAGLSDAARWGASLAEGRLSGRGGSQAIEIAKTDYSGGLKPGQLMKSYVTRYSIEDKAKSVDWYYRDLPEQLRQNIKERGFFSVQLPEYLRRSWDLSLMVGTRLHGIAISLGTPAVYAVHDYRL